MKKVYFGMLVGFIILLSSPDLYCQERIDGKDAVRTALYNPLEFKSQENKVPFWFYDNDTRKWKTQPARTKISNTIDAIYLTEWSHGGQMHKIFFVDVVGSERGAEHNFYLIKDTIGFEENVQKILGKSTDVVEFVAQRSMYLSYGEFYDAEFRNTITQMILSPDRDQKQCNNCQQFPMMNAKYQNLNGQEIIRFFVSDKGVGDDWLEASDLKEGYFEVPYDDFISIFERQTNSDNPGEKKRGEGVKTFLKDVVREANK